MKTDEQIRRYVFHGPTVHDGLEALQRERDKIQDCIDKLTKCVERGILGCNHEPLQGEMASESEQEIQVGHA